MTVSAAERSRRSKPLDLRISPSAAGRRRRSAPASRRCPVHSGACSSVDTAASGSADSRHHWTAAGSRALLGGAGGAATGAGAPGSMGSDRRQRCWWWINDADRALGAGVGSVIAASLGAGATGRFALGGWWRRRLVLGRGGSTNSAITSCRHHQLDSATQQSGLQQPQRDSMKRHHGNGDHDGALSRGAGGSSKADMVLGVCPHAQQVVIGAGQRDGSGRFALLCCAN